MKQYSVALITLPTESHRSNEECLALGYLKASLNLQVPYVHVECVDAWLDGINLEQLCEKISGLNSLICIGISAYFTSIETVGEMITFIKGKYPTVSIVAGGYGPSFNSKAFLDKGVDYVVVGEGDIVFPLMVDKFCHQQSVECLDGLAFKRNGEIRFTKKGLPVQNLDEIPFADRVHMSYAGEIKNPPHISTSRGCMASCSFCSIASFAKLMGDYTNTRWRQRSISNIVDEIEKIHDETGAVVFKIVDDSFIEPPRDAKWVEEFAKEIRKRDMSIRFRTQVRADRLNESMVSSLVEVGWFSTAVGIENGSRGALKRMGKQASLEDNYRCIQLLEKYNVYTVVNMILFDPETSLGELEENLLFLDSLSWGVTKGIFSEMFAAEGTPFTEKLRKTELLNGDSIHMNQRYCIKDQKVLNVYLALKRWTSNHRTVFDRVINPIAAPKVLPTNGYREYYNLARLLYALDLQLFRELVKNPNQTLVFSEVFEAGVQGQHLAISKMADDLDHKYGLSYKLGNNVFLKNE